MKWTTYDGTEATLPPELLVVLIQHAHPDDKEWVYRGSCTGTRDKIREIAETLYYSKTRWLPIPTEAECAAWERLLSWAKHEVESHGESCECAICKALAALETKKEMKP